MRTHRVQITLDNVGCASVVVLAVTFHWVLASRLGLSGFFSGAIAWSVAFLAGLAIVGRIVSRSAKREEGEALAAFAEAKCPSCGAVIGVEAARAIREASRAASFVALRAGAQDGLRVNPRRDWFGACPCCRAAIAFDPTARAIGVDRLAR
jgi:hypothetical protein